MEIEFYSKVLVVFVISGLGFWVMMKMQARKEKEADEKFELTMKLIEMRNKKHGEKNESKN